MPAENPVCLLDTNVVLRFLLADDPEQSRKATAFFGAVEKGERQASIKEFILLELVWVLENACRVPRNEIADKLSTILSFSGMVSPGRYAMIRALLLYKETRIDFADCLLAACSSPATPVVTFDRDLEKLNAVVAAL